MDQLKNVLDGLKKYHFWVLLGVVVVGSVGIWQYATADMGKGTKKRATTLDGHFNSLDGIRQKGRKHPNKPFNENTDKETERQKKNVSDSWSNLREQQKKANELPENLTGRFKEAFEIVEFLSKLGRTPTPAEVARELSLPDEALPTIRKVLNSGGKLSRTHRDDYRTFIGAHLDRLFFEVLKVRRQVAEEKDESELAGAAANGGPLRHPGRERFPPSVRGKSAATGKSDGSETGWVGVVDWDENDRKRVRDRFDWQTLPSTAKVLLAQEDLWVYEALVRVIINTNKIDVGENGKPKLDENGELVLVEPKNHEDAAVKRIITIEIGRDVAVEGDRSKSGRSPGYGAGGAGQGHAADITVITGARGSDAATSSSSPDELETAQLTAGRYVNDKMQPLGPGEIQRAEYDIMPIRMELVINQRWIPTLLAECANSSMPIEVRRFSVRPGKGHVIKSGSGRAGGLSTYSTRFGTPIPTPSRPGVGTAGETETGSLHIPIEIKGIICIYNPPDPDKVGTGGTVEKRAEATQEAPPPETPATPPGPSGASGTEAAVEGGPPGTGR